MTTEAQVLPMLVTEVEVVSVERLSPSFVRVELGSAELADFGVDGPLYDQRVKLVLPHPSVGGRPSVGASGGWTMEWLALPVEERGHMRTYTIREVRGSGADTRIVIDIVLHLEGEQVGPGSTWAAGAGVGDRVVLVAPRRGFPFGGIEFAPGPGAELLMVADETAVPAVCAVLEQLPASARGTVFLEVPRTGDILDVSRPPDVSITWLPREGAPLGERLHDAVVRHLGITDAALDVSPDEVDPDLWETPAYSSSGEEIAAARAVGHELDGLYAWIAGEARVVTGLRRHLVNELDVDRSQVAFMGYWRRGVAMKS